MQRSPKGSTPSSGAVMTGNKSRHGPTALREAIGRLARPAAWPIWIKLSFALLFASLVPMGLTSAYNLYRALWNMEQTEYRNLEFLATSTANRIDQLISDTQSTAAQVADEVEIVSLLSAPSQDREGFRASAQRTLDNVVHSNADIFSVFLLDASGRCVASTNADNLDKDFSFRDYYRESIGGASHVSELLTGTTSARPGVYFSRPVRASGGGVVGVAVVKLKGETLSGMIESLRIGPDSRALLIDAYGVVFIASDASMQYRSLTPLSPELLKLPIFDRRFTSVGVERIESLGLDELARGAVGATASGHVAYEDKVRGGRRFVGYSPLRSKRWTLAILEPDTEFAAPLRSLARKSILTAAVVGGIVTALAVLLARGIVKPLRSLTRAARALREGDFDGARVQVQRSDEIGMLEHAFNTMAKVLKERERERDVFGRVVSPEVREKLLSGELGLGGETRYVAVLFSDIRGFSTMSETMDPHAVVELLNEYLTDMTAAVRPWEGYVNNFIGDAIVVVFGAPVSDQEVERRAARAALAMRDALAKLNDRRCERGDVALQSGIGISAGEVVAGQIGSMDRMLYTVIGDAVNVAARLEAMTKDHPDHPILVTYAVAHALDGQPDLIARSLGQVQVKGRVEPVDLYAVHKA